MMSKLDYMIIGFAITPFNWRLYAVKDFESITAQVGPLRFGIGW